MASELVFLSKRVDKYLSIGKTAINIYMNIDDGKYLDASGNAIMSTADFSIGLYLDIGNTIQKLDAVQTRQAQDYSHELKRLDGLIRDEIAINPNGDKKKALLKKYEAVLKEYKTNMKNLGIEYTKPQMEWKQGY